MSNKYLTQNIDRLDIPTNVIELLKSNEIKKIVIELQFLGLNVKSNY